MSAECQVHHINHLASRNQDTGEAWASLSQRMTDLLGTSAGLVGFSGRKQVGQLIQVLRAQQVESLGPKRCFDPQKARGHALASVAPGSRPLALPDTSQCLKALSQNTSPSGRSTTHRPSQASLSPQSPDPSPWHPPHHPLREESAPHALLRLCPLQQHHIRQLCQVAQHAALSKSATNVLSFMLCSEGICHSSESPRPSVGAGVHRIVGRVEALGVHHRLAM